MFSDSTLMTVLHSEAINAQGNMKEEAASVQWQGEGRSIIKEILIEILRLV